jgi:hypothetical protein
VFGGGATDAFVTKVKPDGSGLIYSGYIGGSFQDSAAGIAVDAAGNAYIAGTTHSVESSFPILVGPDKTFNGDQDQPNAFVVKVSGKPDLVEGGVLIP